MRANWFPNAVKLLNTIVWIDPEGTWTEDADVVTDRVERALLHGSDVTLSPTEIANAVRSVGGVAQTLIGRLRRGRWTGFSSSPHRRTLAAAMRAKAIDAARRRDTGTLKRLDETLEFLAGGHTAGERLFIASLVQSGNRVPEGTRFPQADPPSRPLDLELIGMIVFKP